MSAFSLKKGSHKEIRCVQARTRLIPNIVVLIQKVWRGAICRARYKKMKAALTIVRAYRKYRMRKYVTQVLAAFQTVRQMPDYGKRVRWPVPPKVLRLGCGYLQAIHRRWWAYMVLRRIPRDHWPQMRLKVTKSLSPTCLFDNIRYSHISPISLDF
jgi:myosin-1